MPKGEHARKAWAKVPVRFKEALRGKVADPADELKWVMNNVCVTYAKIPTEDPPSLCAMRLLVEAKDDKGYREILALWARTIPPATAKREGFSDDNRHVFPLLEKLEKEFEQGPEDVTSPHPEEVDFAKLQNSQVVEDKADTEKVEHETQVDPRPEGLAREPEIPSAFA